MNSPSTTKPALHGCSIVAGHRAEKQGVPFHGYHPVDGRRLEPDFFSATAADLDFALSAAEQAAPAFAATSGAERARLLRAIANALDLAASDLVAQAHVETALPLPRLTGEVARTSGQLRFFAGVLEEGSWVMARIDSADPARTPPRPDVRSMLLPLGPVAVFGASNFPLAFSVAGGDTASALAAGNPVIVKAHPAHPATSEIAGQIITAAVAACGMPAGVFSLLFGAGHALGAAIVKDARICAVAFTGSYRGGRALMDIAATREIPIPVYAEMGSTNPVFVLPQALQQRAETLATALHGSFTLGAGQFCTKPGLVFAETAYSAAFVEQLRKSTEAGPAFSLLTEGIAHAYTQAQQARQALRTATSAGSLPDGFAAQAILLETSAAQFAAEPSLVEEVFGPTTLLIHCSSSEEMLQAARNLHGHLTATILGTEADLAAHGELLRLLATKVGRVLFNGFPTGVEVCHAMMHGGPYPATSDGRSTSVGSQAIFRFVRPIAYQGMPQSSLPLALQDENPLGILRLQDGEWKR